VADDKITTNTPSVSDLFKPKKYGIAAQREKAQKEIETLDPLTRANKLGIVFDDSGSMSGQPIKDAHSAIRNFSASCNPHDTSLAIYPLNAESKDLTCNYDLLNIYVSTINATGGTPLYKTTEEALENKHTRLIIFSDGDPTDGNHFNFDDDGPSCTDYHELVIKTALAKETPLDTVFIGEEHQKGYKILKDLAERTGGIFVHFKDAASLSRSLKYLSPGLRGMLMNPDIKAKLERGETL
jgi:Mg-chelatase subunit ChlD